ncbi:MAG: L,D-transpeptidase [Roseibacillus sp.]
MSHKLFPLILALPLILSSCGLLAPLPEEVAETTTTTLPTPSEPEFVNPFPAGTYDHFKAEPNYKKTYNVYRNHSLLSSMTPDSAALRINLSTQRAQLLHNEEVAMDYPVATGKAAYPTPPGDYQILEKIKDKRSNLYGKILNASGGVVKSNADSKTDKVPPGGKFLGASMPYWMRFTWDGIGHHVGNVPRYPASHGCIRGKSSTMPEVYAKVKIGTPVSIVEY